MSNLKRARQTGSFYRRVDKLLRPNSADEDAAEAGPSGQGLSQESEVKDSPVELEHLQEDVDFEQLEGEDTASINYIDIDDDFSDDSDVEDETTLTVEKLSIVDGIRFWALSTNATHTSINLILRVFKRANVKVPATAKTLLKTKRNVSSEITELGGGQFWYHGVKNHLLKYFCTKKPPSKQLSLTLSIDGLPLHNNSTMQFWPIMFSIHEIPRAPVMTAGIFCGLKKPENLEEFLRPIVEELNSLSDGVTIQGENVAVKIRTIVADTPARAFIKGVTGHTGYGACLKCTIPGEYNSASRTVTFPGVNYPKRTDEGFRNDEYPGHRKIPTPLLDLLHFNMIDDVIVSDRLHLIDLGVVKRLFLGWRDGTLGKKRWSAQQRMKISKALEKLLLPSEIHRKVRSIDSAHFWKGSEYASFLHYAAIVILKEHLPDDMYKHFMLLFCAVTLLSSTVYKQKWQLAGQMLDKFVQDFATVYGGQFMSSNVHNLQHVYEEVARLGPLPSISTYPFENELQHLKRLLRSGWRNLEQAVNRLSELSEFRMPRSEFMNYPTIKQHGKTVTLYLRQNFMLQNTERNCWFLLKDQEIVQFSTATIELSDSIDSLCIRGRMINLKGLVFDEPYESSEMYIYKGCANTLGGASVEIRYNQIFCKLVAIPTGNKDEIIFIPLLHTIVQ